MRTRPGLSVTGTSSRGLMLPCAVDWDFWVVETPLPGKAMLQVRIRVHCLAGSGTLLLACPQQLDKTQILCGREEEGAPSVGVIGPPNTRVNQYGQDGGGCELAEWRQI